MPDSDLLAELARFIERITAIARTRQIERVVFVSIGRGEMRMSSGPRYFGSDAAGGVDYFPDLQPSKDNVKFRRPADEAERASNPPGSPPSPP